MQKHSSYLVIKKRLRIWEKKKAFQEMNLKWSHEIYPVLRMTKKNTTMPDEIVTEGERLSNGVNLLFGEQL